VVVDVLANDSDPACALDPNTLRIVQPPTKGTATIKADKIILYTSGSTYDGSDSFSYEVCDNGVPRMCDTATVTIQSALVTSSAGLAAPRSE